MNTFKPGDRVRLIRCGKGQCYTCDRYAGIETEIVKSEHLWSTVLIEGINSYWPNDGIELIDTPDNSPLPLPG
jgi:hypothetical protein